jgi:MFS family permease
MMSGTEYEEGGSIGKPAYAVEDASTSPSKKGSMRRVAFASAVGSMIEAYDFALYGIAAAFVFPKTFFPSLGGSAAVIASIATLGVAFLTRPFGAIFFGAMGDRYGRKATLVATVLLMGLGTALMGLVPSAATIGIAAPILVVLLRAVQGFALGGEWAGGQLFAVEHAPDGKRGLYAMFPGIGNALANFFSPLTMLVVSVSVSQKTFVDWGWRIPFIGSSLLVLLGLYIRLNVEETPVFKKNKGQSAPSRPPLFEAFSLQTSTILRCAGVVFTTFAYNYIVQVFLTGYGVRKLGLPHNSVLLMAAMAGLSYGIFSGVSAIISDRFGRRKVVGWSAVVSVAWALALFPIIDVGTIQVFGIGLCITSALAGMNNGTAGALLPEQFPTRYRYTATSLSYNICAIVGGGLVPLLAPVVIGSYGTFTYSLILASLCLLAAFCTFSLRETAGTSLDWNDLQSRRH